AANLATEPFRAEVKHIALAPDHRVGEINLDFSAKTIRIGTQLAEGLADRDLYRLHYLDTAPCRRLGDNARLIDRGDKGRRTAIHDRYFRAVDFDGGVIDAHPAKGGQHVFGGRNHGALAIAEDG